MDKSFLDALNENIAQITDSDVFFDLYSPSMADFRDDPWPAIQLAIAILLDKPIVLAVTPGRTVPEKLRRIADLTLTGTPDEWVEPLRAFMEKQP